MALDGQQATEAAMDEIQEEEEQLNELFAEVDRVLKSVQELTGRDRNDVCCCCPSLCLCCCGPALPHAGVRASLTATGLLPNANRPHQPRFAPHTKQTDKADQRCTGIFDDGACLLAVAVGVLQCWQTTALRPGT